MGNKDERGTVHDPHAAGACCGTCAEWAGREAAPTARPPLDVPAPASAQLVVASPVFEAASPPRGTIVQPPRRWYSRLFFQK